MVHLRLDDETQAILDDLAADLGLTRSAVVRLALHQLHKAPRPIISGPTTDDVAQQRRSPGRPGPRPSRIAQREASESGPE
jgi:hypothetical protein